MTKNKGLIAIPSGVGAGNPDCADGPMALGDSCQFDEWLLPQPKETKLATVRDICLRLAARTQQLTAERRGFLVVGGDHSAAIGTWGGAAVSLRAQGPLGLIWIDAHMDCHTFSSSPSQNIHGMPLAVLLGQGDPQLTAIGDALPKVQPEHVCLIGVRSYEAHEEALLKKLKVKVFFMDEVERRGMAAVFADALEIVTRGTAGFGVSLDLDGLDPSDAPGVGTPVPNGLRYQEMYQSMAQQVVTHPDFLGFEIMEFNPHLDQANKTLQVTQQLIQLVIPNAGEC